MAALPSSTTALIVGAGPSGLASALSLLHHGVKDIVIVDAQLQGENTSRASAIHAATLESLDIVGCASELAAEGRQLKAVNLRSRTSSFVSITINSLAAHTKFPYVLLIAQYKTERILQKHLEAQGVRVLRPFKVVGLKAADNNDGADVLFENGDVVRTKYVIGADGAKSTIRSLTGINFADPDGVEHVATVDPTLGQVLLADVVFDPEPPFVNDQVTAFACPDGFFFYLPQYELSENGNRAVRIGMSVPLSQGSIPPKPGVEYIQNRINMTGPPEFSSDPSVTPKPLKLKEVVWSTRFRTHSAIADTFLTAVPSQTGHQDAVVVLVGDSAHIHSPAGGQGMNLGLRDAVALGPVVAAHIQTADPKVLQEYASVRHDRALKTIRLTKRIMALVTTLINSTGFRQIPYWVIKFLMSIPFVQRMAVWTVSGLGRR